MIGMQYAQVTAIVLIAGFAIQQALQVLDYPISALIGRYRRKHRLPTGMTDPDFKKIVMTVIAFVFAALVVWKWGIRTLIYVDKERFSQQPFADGSLTALVLSAGTEGVNTLIKYFGYIKEARGAVASATSKVIGVA
jgi:hypothetical protein